MLVSGLPLYMTVTATDSAGLKAYSTCSLQNYDTTPPSGRLTSQFSTTSHPHVLRASLVATNDSELTVQ